MFKNKRQVILSTIILVVALSFGVIIGAVTWIIQDTPDITNYKGTSEATMIYGADGQLLTKLYQQNRIYVDLERIPKDLQNAIVAIEDTSFYVHHGIDFWGIARALITNIIKQRDRPHGASTITQQLAGNALLNRQQVTYYRKIQEAYLAMQFERLYTKPEILEMYLNEILFGHSAYGVESAAQQYFNKHVWELTLSESALIAGLPKAPNYYSPFNNYEAAIFRRNVVLNRMLELGYITEEEAREAKNQEIELKSADRDNEVAPYFVRYVRDELIERFGAQIVYSGGLKVYTTLDLEMQKKAEKAVQQALEAKYIPTVIRDNTASKEQPQLAVITIDPRSGEIRSMVGGRGNDQFNRAVQAVRQPGSAFKPFVYTTAVKQGDSPASIVNDMPMLASEDGEPAKIWPRNFEDEYRGFVNYRTALKHSINVAAVKVLQKAGVSETIKTAKEMGITTFQPQDGNRDHLSLALGGLTKGVTPLEMASAYGVFANSGVWVEPIAITRVLDNRNQVLYRAHPEKKLVLSEDVAYIMTDLLRTVIKEGTGWRADLKRPVAGKTGTTNDYTDAWFVGFTPDLVTSVWIGEDNLKTMVYNERDSEGKLLFPENGRGRTVSSSEAARLWGNYMRDVVKDMPVNNFTKPDNIATGIEIDPVTGLLPNSHTPTAIKEIFREENIPTRRDYIHQPIATVKVDKESWLLATDNCPQENIIEYNYFADSGIRIGPAKFTFGQKSEDGSEIKGTYLVDKGEPIQVYNPKTGEPVTSKTGQVLYEKIPEEYCNLHPQQPNKIFDSIWNFFQDNF